MSDKERMSSDGPRDAATAQTLPAVVTQSESAKTSVHPSVYIASWIALSSTIIIFNKWILNAGFPFPLFLTTWHLGFASLMTQILARYTTILDSRHNVPMTSDVYIRTIVPVGIFFSLSLICGNLTYLYLSVSFIQMLKATNSVATLVTTWVFGLAPPNFRTLGNVSLIVIGVGIASFGEIKFVLVGFLYQLGGIVFEAIRLVMVQRLLSSAEFKMDPLVSLYYFAPACALMNGVCMLFAEVPSMTIDHFARIGVFTLLSNAMLAFLLNVSAVLLIGKTNALVLTLSGVLKDILLVFASMLIFKDPVTPLQFFGYSIALGGLVYYKLGGDQLKQNTQYATQAWADFGAKRPVARKVVVIGAGVAVFFIVLGGLSPLLPDQTKMEAYTKWTQVKDMGHAGGRASSS